ncbi:hypothetical protein M408DRAFT_35623, partial [Serendipita vermifera MAFF 305830]
MWSFVHRERRSVLELQDTNNLVESWHRALKVHFLDGKRNHRVDVVCQRLVEVALDHFRTREARQIAGFEGRNL